MKTKINMLLLPFLTVTTIFSFSTYANDVCESVFPIQTVPAKTELKDAETLLKELKGKRIDNTKKKLLSINESTYFEIRKTIDISRQGDELDLGMFIFENDYTSSDIASRLIKAAKRGVKINVTVDYVMGLKFKKWYQFLAQQNENIKIGLFNPPQKEGLELLQNRFNVSNPQSFFDGLAMQNKNLIFQSIHGSKLEMVLGLVQKFKAAQNAKTTDAQPAQNSAELNPMEMLAQLSEAQKYLSETGIEIHDMQNLIKTITEFTMRLHHKLIVLKSPSGKLKYIVAGRNISDEYLLSLVLYNKANGKMVESSQKNPLLANRSYPFIDTAVVVETLENSPEANSITDYLNRINNTADIERISAQNGDGSMTLTESETAEFTKLMQDNSAQLEANLGQMKRKSRHPLARIRLHHGQSDIYLENAPREGRIEIHEAWRKLLSEGSFAEAHIFSAYLYPTAEDRLSMEAFLNNNPKASLNLYTNSPKTTDMNIVNFTFYVNQGEWFVSMKEKFGDRFQVLELIREPGEGSLHMKQMVLVGNNGQKSIIINGSAHEDSRSVLYDANAASASVVENSKAQRVLKAYGSTGPLAVNWFAVTKEYIDEMVKYAKEKFGSRLEVVHKAGPIDDEM
ncbi:MAG: phospholipase D-like domain-containing protein [Bdellovibrio sp.]